MSRATASLTLALLITGFSSPASSGTRPKFQFPKVITAFNTMYGVDGPFVGPNNPVRGVRGDGLPWESPAVVDGRYLVFGGCDAQLHVVNLKDGTLVHKIPTSAQIPASIATFGTMAFCGNYANETVAFDVVGGTVAWTYRDRALPFFSAPAVNERLVLIGSRDKNLHAIDRYAPLLDPLEAVYAHQHCRLAGPRTADHRQDLALLHCQIHAFQNLQCAELFVHVLDCDHCVPHFFSC